MEHNKTFYLNSGRKFSNLKSFVKELMEMPKEVYSHHVNDGKNDFAVWSNHSLKEKDLAKKIDGEIDKIEMELKVLRHLVHSTPTKNVNIKKSAVKVEVKKLSTKKKTTSK